MPRLRPCRFRRVTLSVPAEAMIGENLSFSAAFSNTSPTDPGYGPYIDLIFPVHRRRRRRRRCR